MKIKAIFLIISLIFISISIYSQVPLQTFKGNVKDLDSHYPLPGASIVILDTDPLIGITTDMEGNFKIEKVPVGRYNVQVSYLGYEEYVIKEFLIGAGKEAVLNVELKEAIVNLNEVSVKAFANKEKPLNGMATLSARQLSVEEARRYAGGGDDPARLASSFAGASTGLANNGIVIRGNAPKGLLWRMEGVEISNPNHFANLVSFGGGGQTALSSQMLANSDFYTGAFPAEYGNALSGVFDLKMRTGNNEKREHTFQLGGIGIDIASEGPFLKGRKSSYLFNYRYSTLRILGPILPPEAGVVGFQDLSFKFNFPFGKYGTIALWGLGAKDSQFHEAEMDSLQWKNDKDREIYKSKLSMGVAGMSYKLILGKKSYLQSVIAASGNGISFNNAILSDSLIENREDNVINNEWKYSFSAFLNNKFSARHTNRTGFIYNNLNYRININRAIIAGLPMTNYVDENGQSNLLQAYSQSRFDMTEKIIINAGFHCQIFTLNNHYTLEPRLGIKWQPSSKHSFSMAYGIHSRLEMLSFYLARQNVNNVEVLPNIDLDFTKAHHFVFGYDLNINQNMRLKIEPYFQYLYNVPVIRNSYYSLQNLESSWFMNDSLINEGKGKNLGIDFTFERFLLNGYYYLCTASLFDSKYEGGDGIERNSRFDKNYVVNLLAGKEWNTGKNKQNTFSINGRISFIGGDRVIPIDRDASLLNENIIYNTNLAFEDKKPDAQIVSMTINYRINKARHSSIWSFQIMNILGQKEFEGYRYDKTAKTIIKEEDAFIIPNISYKIEF